MKSWKVRFILGFVGVFTFSLLCPSLMQLPRVHASHVTMSCGQNMPEDDKSPATDNSHCQQKYQISGIQIEKRDIKDIVESITIVPAIFFHFELPFLVDNNFFLAESRRERIERENTHIRIHKKE